MACPAIQTGANFIASAMVHIDCQSQVLGAYGFGALADPGSIVAVSLTGLLTIFIALFGLRMLIRQQSELPDWIDAVLRVGIVLTLATSWPAWRVLGYDLVVHAPREIAGSLASASGLGTPKISLTERIQNADNGLVAMTTFGSGRLTGGIVGGSDRGDSFGGIAMADQTGFAWGRVAFMVAIIAPYAISNLMAGLLLAIAPLVAGLLLFSGTQGLFSGWVRGLVFCALAVLTLSMVYAAELAMIGPWIADVLRERAQNAFTPSAPTELLVFALAFCLTNFGVLTLVARIAFMPEKTLERFTLPSGVATKPVAGFPIFSSQSPNVFAPPPTLARVQLLSDSLTQTVRREEDGLAASVSGRSGEAKTGPRSEPVQMTRQGDLSGGISRQRAHRRTSLAGTRRDGSA